MAKGEQIDGLSKMYVKLSKGAKTHAKKLHKRHLRRTAKRDTDLDPKPNRYDGWIG